MARGTHGKDTMENKIPTRVPISRMSEIAATHGMMSALNAPAKKPYIAANSMMDVIVVAKGQNTSVRRPMRKTEGNMTL